jgi:hypothetical protein
MIAYTGGDDFVVLKQLLVTDMGFPISDDDLQRQAADLIGAAFKPTYPAIELDIRGRGGNLYIKGFKRLGERLAPVTRQAGSEADASSQSSWGRLKQKLVTSVERGLPNFKYFEEKAALVGRKMEHKAEGIDIKAQEYYQAFVKKFGELPK